MLGASKLGALCTTYPYQVIRSRIEVRLPLLRVQGLCGCAEGRLGASALASSYDHVDHRAYMDP
jgi:hypothetical protein